MSIWYARVGDANKVLETVLALATGDGVNILNTATVTFTATLRGAQITGEAMIQDQSDTAGWVTYALTDEDLDPETCIDGWYEVHWTVEWDDGSIDSFPLGGFDTLVVEPAP